MVSNNDISIDTMKTKLQQMGEKAKIAAHTLALMSAHEKDECLQQMAEAIEKSAEEIKAANLKDMKAGEKNGLSAAMLDRLKLDDKRILSMADGLRTLTELEDPVARTLDTIVRPNGLTIEKVSVPIGVIGIVFESRPNVTVDAAALCFKAGNAVILRGGSEAINSNLTLAHILARSGQAVGMPEGAIQLIPWTDREAVSIMLKMDNYLNLIIPRGGEGLIRAVVEQATIPVIKHYKGVCHIFVDCEADLDMAQRLTVNAKCQRPGVCNAVETLLIHRDIAAKFAPAIAEVLKSEGVELRGDSTFAQLCPGTKAASEQDWYEEYLEKILAVRIVDNVEQAVEHINTYGSGHSDAIVTQNNDTAKFFMDGVDSAAVYVNASTRFTDGGEFGMGAEIGISTDRLHARGPMGLQELTTYKYYVFGNGQARE